MGKQKRNIQSKVDREAREQIDLAQRRISQLILLVSIFLPPLTVMGIANIGGAFGQLSPQDLLLRMVIAPVLLVNAPLFLVLAIGVIILMAKRRQSLVVSGAVLISSVLYSIFIGYLLLFPR